MIGVTFTGRPEEVERQVQAYLRRFHPHGYGTFIASRVTNADGTETAHLRRWEHCD